MNKSESIKELAAALSKFQGEVTNPKNISTNPYFNSKYSPLDEVVNTVKPVLSKHGLSYMQFPSTQGDNILITTVLFHESGEWIEGAPLMVKSEKPTAQSAGSAITYARRYALCAVLGIAGEEDTDAGKPKEGTNNNGQEKQQQGNKAPQENKGELKCSDCGKDISKAVHTYSVNTFKKSLCRDCQDKLKTK